MRELVHGVGDERLIETLNRSGLGNNEWLIRQLAIFADRKAMKAKERGGVDRQEGTEASGEAGSPFSNLTHQSGGDIGGDGPLGASDENPNGHLPDVQYAKMDRRELYRPRWQVPFEGGGVLGYGGGAGGGGRSSFGRSRPPTQGLRPGHNIPRPPAASETATRPGLGPKGDYQPGRESGRRALPPIAPQEEGDQQDRTAPGDPEVSPERRESLLESFVHRLVEFASGGSRGNPLTQHGNNILVQECLDILKKEYPNIADQVVHSGGGNKGGDPSKPEVKERFLAGPEGGHKGANKADASFAAKGLEGKKGRPLEAHANTASVRKSGGMTGREQSAFDRLVEKVGSQLATWLPKLRPGMDEDDYRRTARDACRRIMGNLEKEMERVKKEMREENKKKRDDTDKADESDLDSAE